MMKKFSQLITICLLAGIYIPAISQTVTVDVQPPVVVEGERFRVTYNVENAQATDIKVGDIEGCNKLSGPGVTSSSSINIINGKRTEKSSYSYSYIYRAISAGTHAIPAATLTLGGKQIQSKATSIKVLPPDQSAVPGTSGGGSSHSQGDAQQSTSATTNNQSRFIRLNLNKTKVYEHEAIECVLTLYSTDQATQLNYKTPPSFDGFLTQDVDNYQGQPTMENINGRNYIIYPLRKYILFPQKTGKLEVSPGQLTMLVTEYETYESFFGRQLIPVGESEVIVSGAKTTVDVQALPHPQPASFNGAVGRFTLESQLNPTSLKTNEAATIKIILTGTGNIGNVRTPKPELPIDFEQYTPSEDISTRVSGSTVTGMITTEYTFVPQSVGKFEIPEVEFSYFDPSKKDYVILTAGGYNIDVARGAGVSTGIVEQEDIKARATDILHIHRTDASALSKSPGRPVIYKPLFWIIWVAVIAGAAAFLIIHKKQMKKRADIVGMKTARAGRVAKKRLRAAKKFMDAGDSDAFHAEVLKALWGYISDRLAIPVADLNRTNVSEKLAGHGMSEEEIAKVIELLDECEMARYTTASAMRDMPEIYRSASDAMDNLSKITRK